MHHDAGEVSAEFPTEILDRALPGADPVLAAYLRRSFASEDTTDVRFSEPLVGQDGRAVAEFRVLAREDGRPTTLAGCVLVRFDAAGLAVETRDYWHSTPESAPALPWRTA